MLCATLRADGFDGRLLLIGDQVERPYERPPLSKAYLPTSATRTSSTGPTRSIRAQLRPATCSASPPPYARLPYFYSAQYDLGMEYSGFAAAWDRVVVSGDPADRSFIAFWLKDQRVLAGMNASTWDVVQDIQTLIRSGLPVDPAWLADPDVPLDQVTDELTARSAR